MNKIVHFTMDDTFLPSNISIKFQKIPDLEYKEEVETHYFNNLGIEFIEWWGYNTKKAKIINELKFTLFMLNYSDYIIKIENES